MTTKGLARLMRADSGAGKRAKETAPSTDDGAVANRADNPAKEDDAVAKSGDQKSSGAEPEKTGNDGEGSEDQRQPKATGARAAAKDGAGKDNVRDFDAERERRQGFADATRIANLCTIAGCPERVHEFLEKETPVAEVERALLKHRAEQAGDDVTTQHSGDSRTQPTLKTADIYAKRRAAMTKSA